jgi:hypothetical protein
MNWRRHGRLSRGSAAWIRALAFEPSAAAIDGELGGFAAEATRLGEIIGAAWRETVRLEGRQLEKLRHVCAKCSSRFNKATRGSQRRVSD